MSPVDAPGRCRFAKPSRAQAARGAGTWRDDAVRARPPSQNSANVANAATQNPAANFRSGDVAITSPASTAASATFTARRTTAPTKAARQQRITEQTPLPEICAARANGQSANTPAVSRP